MIKIAVMGAGGVGGYFGGRLARAGTEVAFIARGAHLQAMRERGLKVRAHDGDFEVEPARACERPSEVGPVDLVLFCVKMWDVERAAAAVRPLVGEGTGVITLQNGVEAVDLVARSVGREHVLGGAAYVSAAMAEPGVIVQSGSIARIVFGELDGSPTPRARDFVEAGRAAGFDVELSDDVERDQWTKFVFICALSGVSTLTRHHLDRILHDPETRELFVACLRETAAVGRARGVRLPAEVVERALAYSAAVASQVRSSMLHDLEHRNRLELEWLNGAVARLGAEAGVPTPVSQFIYAALKLHAAGSPG